MDLETAEKWAQIAAAGVSAAAFTVTAAQFAKYNRHHREQITTNTWRDYEKVSLENPDLSLVADNGEFDFENRRINGDDRLFERYEWYISFMLLACEEALDAFNHRDWLEAVEEQLRRHQRFLKSDYFRGSTRHNKKTISMLTPGLRRLILTVVR